MVKKITVRKFYILEGILKKTFKTLYKKIVRKIQKLINKKHVKLVNMIKRKIYKAYTSHSKKCSKDKNLMS